MSAVIEEIRKEDIPVYSKNKELIDKVIVEVTQKVNASFAKAVMHKSEPTRFPISLDSKSGERIALEFLGHVKSEKQATALNKTRSTLANEAERRKHFGQFAEPHVLANPEGIAHVWRGHHLPSHSEGMTDGKFAAMVSTQSEPWASIPRAPLMARLNEKTRKHIVRSDWLSVKDAPVPMAHAELSSPSTLPKGFHKGDLWFDYVIKMS